MSLKHKNIKAEKAALRSEYRALREAFPQEKKKKLDRMILQKLLTLREYERASTVFCYVSKEFEVNTIPILEHTLSSGRRLAVPHCIPGTPYMDFYEIHSLDDLAPGSFGLLEPKIEVCQKVTDLSSGLCILPGFCFDRQGYRLGYGKGYYDRFLSAFSGSSAGICYTSFVVDALPHGYFDRCADIMVTEKYIHRLHR